MPVILSEDEIKTFTENGYTPENIQETVNSYREAGLDDDSIRAKVDLRLNEFQKSSDLLLQGGVQYNDILDNKDLSKEQKLSEINRRSIDYRQRIEDEKNDNIHSAVAGGVTKILAPAAGLIPGAGIPLAGAIYGIGQGIEDKDNLNGILGKGALYGGASYLGGAIGGKAASAIPSIKSKVTEALLKRSVYGGAIGGFDGAAEAIKDNINNEKTDFSNIAQNTLGGILGGAIINGAVQFAPQNSLKNTVLQEIADTKPKLHHTEIEEYRQLIKDGILTKRAISENKMLEAQKIVDDFISETKNLSNEYGINDKNLREMMVFLRENTGLPMKLDRADILKDWSRLTQEQKINLKTMADTVSAKMEKYWQEYSNARGGVTFYDPESYITHLWDITEAEKAQLSNYLRTFSKFQLQRIIDTYAKGIDGIKLENGKVLSLRPKTLDYAEILKEHAKDVIEATANAHYTNWLQKIKLSNGSKIFDKAREGYVPLVHKSLPKDTYVHASFKDVLDPVYETAKEKTKFGKTYDTVNNFAKTCKFLLNAMHGIALTETAAAHESIIPFKTLKTLVNIPKIIDGIKHNNYKVFEQSALAKQAIRDGVQFGSLTDVNIEEFTTGLDNVIHLIDNASFGLSKPLTKPLRKLVDVNNKVLWNYLHNTYKLDAYDTLIKRYQTKSKVPLSKNMRREIGQIVNDTFGGQNWDVLGIKPSSLQIARRILLSPDWNMSAFIRQSLSVFSSGTGQKVLNYFASKNELGSSIREFSRKVGLSSITNDVEAASLRGDISRQFFFRFVVQSAIYSNLVNVASRALDRTQNPEMYDDNSDFWTAYDNNRFTENDSTLTQVTDTIFPRPFVGRDKNGRELYARTSKQAREVPEFIEDGIEGAIGKIASKSSPLINPVVTKVADDYTDGWNKEEILERYKKTFQPFSLSKEEFNLIDTMYSTTKGTNYYQAKDYIESSLKEGDLQSIKDFFHKMKMNNLDSDRLIKKVGRNIMFEAMINNEPETIEKIWNDLDKLGVNSEKAYKSAVYSLLDFRKEYNFNDN